jgi:hypothetical protein
MMTRKDFEKIAFIVRGIRDRITRLEVASEFAGMLADDNPRFDRVRFFQACNVDVTGHY